MFPTWKDYPHIHKARGNKTVFVLKAFRELWQHLWRRPRPFNASTLSTLGDPLTPSTLAAHWTPSTLQPLHAIDFCFSIEASKRLRFCFSIRRLRLWLWIRSSTTYSQRFNDCDFACSFDGADFGCSFNTFNASTPSRLWLINLLSERLPPTPS